MEEVVRKNLEMLLGEEKGSLNYALRQSPESMGGNAGYWGNYPCIGANFSINQNTGEIVYFGNIQDVPPDIREKYAHGIFRMAINLRIGQILEAVAKGTEAKKPEGTDRKIVGSWIDPRASYTAKSVLEETVRRYNVFSSIKE